MTSAFHFWAALAAVAGVHVCAADVMEENNCCRRCQWRCSASTLCTELMLVGDKHATCQRLRNRGSCVRPSAKLPRPGYSRKRLIFVSRQDGLPVPKLMYDEGFRHCSTLASTCWPSKYQFCPVQMLFVKHSICVVAKPPGFSIRCKQRNPPRKPLLSERGERIYRFGNLLAKQQQNSEQNV